MQTGTEGGHKAGFLTGGPRAAMGGRYEIGRLSRGQPGARRCSWAAGLYPAAYSLYADCYDLMKFGHMWCDG